MKLGGLDRRTPIGADPGHLTSTLTVVERRHEGTTIRAAIDATEKSVGGRTTLISALSLAKRTHGVDELLMRLEEDPEGEHRLSFICGLLRSPLTAGELLDAILQGNQHHNELVISRVAREHIEAMAEESFRRAAPYEEPCSRCGGHKTIVKDGSKDDESGLLIEVPCPTCRGTGTQRHLPGLEDRKFGLALAGIDPYPRVPLVDASRHLTMHHPGPDGLAKLLRSVDQVLYGRGAAILDPIDGEVIEDRSDDRAEFAAHLFAALDVE